MNALARAWRYWTRADAYPPLPARASDLQTQTEWVGWLKAEPHRGVNEHVARGSGGPRRGSRLAVSASKLHRRSQREELR